MRDRLWIITGLALFVAAVTAPFWSVRTSPTDLNKLPDLTLPANQKQCVVPASTMRVAHMQLLVSWREDVVRRGDRKYVAFNGKVYEKSLTKTCLGCHSKEQFCDRCHAYTGVSGPSCWNCHNQPQSRFAGSFPQTMDVQDDVMRWTQDSTGDFLSQKEKGVPSPFRKSMP